MRKAKVLIFIVFILCILALGGSFYLHKVFFERLQYFTQEQDHSAEKIESFSTKLDDYRNNLNELDARFAQYSDILKRLQETVGAVKTTDVAASIEALKNNVEGLRSSYTSTITALQEKINMLEAKVGPPKAASVNQKVQLGELSVEKKK